MASVSVKTIAVLVVLSLVLLAAGSRQEDGGRLFTQAREQFEKAEYDQALELCEQYLREFPRGSHSASAAFIIGECYYRTERYNQAMAAFGRANEHYADSPEAAAILDGLGRAKLRLGLVQESIDHFGEALRKSPDPELSLELSSRLAEILYEQENYEEAKDHYAHLLELLQEPADVNEVRIKLADCYYRVREYEKARELFSLFLEHDQALLDEAPELAFRWAETLLFSGDLDGARSILGRLVSRFSGHPIHAHAVMRLGDLERRAALAAADTSERDELLRKAIGYYQRLLLTSDVEWRVADERAQIFGSTAAIKVLETADLGDIDLEAEFNFPPARSLLNNLLQSSASSETKALALLRLARHYLAVGREREALESYKELLRNHSQTRLVPAARAERSRLARILMEESWERGDFNSYVDLYLGHGPELMLSIDDKIRLAESYARLQIYDRAEALFREILSQVVPPEIRRRATLGLARVELSMGGRAAALGRLEQFLSEDQPAAEREKALLLLLDVHFEERNLAALQKIWREGEVRLGSPELQATALFKLAMLSKINGLLTEATELFERFLLEFGEGVSGSLRIYGYLADTYLALGDLYYDEGQWRVAAGRYEMFIALFGKARDVAWPLFQSANCHRRIGELELAIEIYEELIRLYPNSTWSSQARVTLDELTRATGRGSGR